MNTERRDKRLMLDMLRSPATLFFRDDQIAIIQPADYDSYIFYAPVVHIRTNQWGRRREFNNTYIVRCNNKEYFEVTKTAGHMPGGRFEFGVSAYLDSHVGNGEFDTIKTYSRSLNYYLKKYPSLYDAFGTLAEKMGFLPMVKDQTDEVIWSALEADRSNLRFIENLTHKRKVKILERWPSTIESMNQTPELCELIVRADGANISYVSEHLRTQKLCERAVSTYAMALQYVPHKTEKICLMAIKRDAMALQFVKNPSIKLMVAAVNRSPSAWDLIKKEKVRKEVKKAKKMKKYRS